MGIIYSVSCKKCKVTRDLDKFYSPVMLEGENRKSMLKYMEQVKEDPFRHGLLATFMDKHAGHDCVFFLEGMECEEELDPFDNKHGYVEDVNYWALEE